MNVNDLVKDALIIEEDRVCWLTLPRNVWQRLIEKREDSCADLGHRETSKALSIVLPPLAPYD